jgi:signal transduction histidine kinase
MPIKIKSIRTKILFAIFVVIFILQSTSILLQYYQNRSLLIVAMEQRAVISSSQVFPDISDRLKSLNTLAEKKSFLEVYANLKGSIVFPNLLSQIQDLKSINFVDNAGKIIAGDNLGGQIDSYATKLISSNVSGSIEERNSVITYVPFIVDNNSMGGLVYYFSNESIQREENALLLRSGITLLIYLIIGFLATLFVSRQITKPLKILLKGTEEIAKGNLNYVIKLKTDDEIGNLASSFNLMTKNLLRSSKNVDDKVKELSVEHGKLSSLVESVKLGVIMVDLSLNVILANSAAKRILGKESGESIVFGDLSGRIKDSINISQALSFYVKSGKPLNVQEAVIDDKYYRLFMSPVRDIVEKIFIGAVVVMEDITEEKKLDKMRTEIVSITSHQLRTPATIIKGNLEMVLGGDVGIITPMQKELLDDTYMGNERMIRLINDLMDVAKIDEGKFKIVLDSAQFEDVVADVVKAVSPLAVEKKVSLVYDYPTCKFPPVKINRQRVSQVIQNLVDNAVKYSSVGDKGAVKVDIEEGANFLELVVKDNGIGIPEKEQNKMFERFSRGSNSTKLDPGGGSGLGLYIAKAVVEQGGGRIWFESKENEGTTFHATFPYN